MSTSVESMFSEPELEHGRRLKKHTKRLHQQLAKDYCTWLNQSSDWAPSEGSANRSEQYQVYLGQAIESFEKSLAGTKFAKSHLLAGPVKEDSTGLQSEFKLKIGEEGMIHSLYEAGRAATRK